MSCLAFCSFNHILSLKAKDIQFTICGDEKQEIITFEMLISILECSILVRCCWKNKTTVLIKTLSWHRHVHFWKRCWYKTQKQFDKTLVFSTLGCVTQISLNFRTSCKHEDIRTLVVTWFSTVITLLHVALIKSLPKVSSRGETLGYKQHFR